MSLTATRKSKWHLAPPPPPTPRILNLPRRIRRRRTCRTVASSSYGGIPVIVSRRDPEEQQQRDYTGKLESLLDRERKFADNFVPVAERIENVEEKEIKGDGFMEEKWRFQAEILRAECNFLRMEREIALKKLESNRTQMEITLRSAVEGLVSGRKKIHEGKSSLNDVLEEEIEYLEEMHRQLQRGSYATKDLKVKKCSNFDRKAVLLRRRLESLGAKEIQPTTTTTEENELAASDENSILIPNSITSHSEKNSCSGRCKSIVKRIVEQVRAETDQWSQMQEMVGRVRDEMEELQLCREFWEDRALDSEFESRSLRCLVQEWREKAMNFESKAKELETEASSLREKLNQKKKNKEERNDCRDIAPSSEKLVLSCGLKKEKHRQRVSGNRSMVVPRLAFRDIGNSLSPNGNQKSSSKGIFPLNFHHK